MARTPWPASSAVPLRKRPGLPKALQDALQPRQAPLRPAKAGPTAPEPPTRASWCSAPAGCCRRSAGHQALACAPTASIPLVSGGPPAPHTGCAELSTGTECECTHATAICSCATRHCTSSNSGCLRLASALQHCCASTAVHCESDCSVLVLELPVRMPVRKVLQRCTLLLSAGSQIVAALQQRCHDLHHIANLHWLAIAGSKNCRFPPQFSSSQRGASC